MNLHQIASGYISAVNPMLTVAVKRSTGYTTGNDGTRTPTYAPVVNMAAQVQALQYNDIIQLDGLNLTGERRAIYINGNWEGVIRADGRGGDIITFPDGSVWLVVFLFENWQSQDGWVKLAVTRQVS
jgi:hypothetical protein